MIFPAVKKTFFQLLGPSVLFVALSLNGGEMLLWPDLIGQYGLQILWIVPVILYLQYSVNIEIERYTLTTGKNALTKLSGLTSVVAWLVVVSVLISLLWPAWIATAGSMAGVLFQNPDIGSYLSIIFLICIILLWSNKNSYKIIENAAKVGMITVLIVSIGVVTYLLGFTDAEIFISTDTRDLIPSSDSAIAYVAALAFGGVSGVLNLVQSDWIAERKYGATSVENPEEIDFEHPDSQKNWKQWWSMITKEHFVLFFLGNIVGISIIGLAASLTLQGSGESGFGILSYQVETLNDLQWGVGLAWGVGIIMLFWMAQTTILDAAGKLLKRTELGVFEKVSAERLSQITGGIGILVLLAGIIWESFAAPAFLLQTSAVLSAAIMATYPALLVWFNRKLPSVARPKLYSQVSAIACAVFYGGVVIWMLTTL